ncbi:MAG: UDP-N-acetylmuramoyl-L-alanine--D-glutamate ligase [candidate division WOR-3 bacterium]
MKKLYFGKVNIIGFGLSGKAVYNLLKGYGNSIKIFEHSKLNSKENIKIHYDAFNSDIYCADLIVPSPGVSYKILRKFLERNILVLPEIEIGYYNIDKQKSFLIGITGTNGKTTTSTLIAHLLKHFNSQLYGNVGNAFCNNTREYGVFVLELSSFQLSIIRKFKLNCGILLNIEEDHLDWHLNFENYISSKLNIFKNQDERDFSVLNLDDNKIIKNFKQNLSKVFYFSALNEADCYYKNGKVFLFSREILELKNFPNIYGIHNIYNVLASTLAIWCYLKDIETVKNVLNERLASFKVPEHRLEFVREINGIKFYNDSKSTNPHSVKYALLNFDKCILIMGGLTKEANFNILNDIIKERVRFIVAFGKNKRFFYEKFKEIVDVFEFDDLDSAVKFAFSRSKGEPILFSPGGSSFDLFKDYKHRGKAFKEIVNKL